MELTVGTTLQGGKYIIQEVLSQSEGEIIYRATHTYLDQPVLLRSLHPTTQQRDNFTEVKQQFITAVRAQVKQPNPGQPAILDCFEENNLPFAVLLFQSTSMPSSPPPPLAAIVSPEAALPTEAVSSQNASLKTVPPAHLVSAFEAAWVELDEKNRPPGQPLPVQDLSPTMSSSLDSQTTSAQQSRGSQYEPINGHSHLASVVASPSNGHRQVNSSRGRSSSHQHQKLPIALMMVALTGGCIGAGTGLALRLDAAYPEAGKKPRLSLFHREQSFPATGNWPIRERYSPEPTLEQPLYRAIPSPESAPAATIPPLPADPVPLPEPSIAVEKAKPLPQDFELPTDPTVPPVDTTPKLPDQALPLPELETPGEVSPRVDRLPPISPDNLLPPSPATPAPLPPPADQSIRVPPPLKSLPAASGI
jgi:hypothetical protein